MTTDPSSTLESASDQLSVVRDKAQTALSGGEQYVRDNPWPTILGALVIGALLGLLLRKRELKPISVKDNVQGWLDSCCHNLPSSKELVSRISSKEQALRRSAEKIGKKLRCW